MGYVRANIEIGNPRNPKLEKIKKNALVDTGALMLCIPEHIRVQMGFEELEKREITTADDRKQLVPYVGPVLVHFENRNCFVGALVLGDDILLGAVPMEDMDLIVSPAHKKVVVNPDSPNFPQALVNPTSTKQFVKPNRIKANLNMGHFFRHYNVFIDGEFSN